MYYDKTGAFDRSPLNKVGKTKLVPEQPDMSDGDNSENNELVFWVILVLGGIGILLVVRHINSPSLKNSRIIPTGSIS